MPESSFDYDSVETFAVDPSALLECSRLINQHSKEIVDSLVAIQNSMTQLELGWAGRTAEEAQDFGRRWQGVAGQLFGTQEEPERGVLMVIAAGVATVAEIFARTEDSLQKFFQEFGTALVGGSPDEQPTFGPRDDITDVSASAVAQRW